MTCAGRDWLKQQTRFTAVLAFRFGWNKTVLQLFLFHFCCSYFNYKTFSEEDTEQTTPSTTETLRPITIEQWRTQKGLEERGSNCVYVKKMMKYYHRIAIIAMQLVLNPCFVPIRLS